MILRCCCDLPPRIACVNPGGWCAQLINNDPKINGPKSLPVFLFESQQEQKPTLCYKDLNSCWIEARPPPCRQISREFPWVAPSWQTKKGLPLLAGTSTAIPIVVRGCELLPLTSWEHTRDLLVWYRNKHEREQRSWLLFDEPICYYSSDDIHGVYFVNTTALTEPWKQKKVQHTHTHTHDSERRQSPTHARSPWSPQTTHTTTTNERRGQNHHHSPTSQQV